jgi:hypothetical protein
LHAQIVLIGGAVPNDTTVAGISSGMILNGDHSSELYFEAHFYEQVGERIRVTFIEDFKFDGDH